MSTRATSSAQKYDVLKENLAFCRCGAQTASAQRLRCACKEAICATEPSIKHSTAHVACCTPSRYTAPTPLSVHIISLSRSNCYTLNHNMCNKTGSSAALYARFRLSCACTTTNPICQYACCRLPEAWMACSVGYHHDCVVQGE